MKTLKKYVFNTFKNMITKKWPQLSNKNKIQATIIFTQQICWLIYFKKIICICLFEMFNKKMIFLYILGL